MARYMFVSMVSMDTRFSTVKSQLQLQLRITLEPTNLPFVADRVQWHVYGSTEQIHDSKIGDENVWNCS